MPTSRTRRLRFTCTAIAAVIAATLVGPSFLSDLQAAEDELPIASPESVGMSSERLERVNAYFRRYIDANQIAGAVTLIARNGKVVHYEEHCNYKMY